MNTRYNVYNISSKLIASLKLNRIVSNVSIIYETNAANYVKTSGILYSLSTLIS